MTVDLAKAQPIDPSKQKQKDKRVAELDELVKAKARELTAVKFRSTLVAMATVVGMYSLLSNTYGSPRFASQHSDIVMAATNFSMSIPPRIVMFLLPI